MAKSLKEISREISRSNMDNPFVLRHININNGDKRYPSFESAVADGVRMGFEFSVSQESIAKARTFLVATWSVFGGLRIVGGN